MNLIAPPFTVEVPDWVTYPEEDWIQITPEEAGRMGTPTQARRSDQGFPTAHSGAFISQYHRHGKTGPTSVCGMQTTVANTTGDHANDNFILLRRSEV